MSPVEVGLAAGNWITANLWKLATLVFAAGGFVAVTQHQASTYATKQHVAEAIAIHERQSEGRVLAIEAATDTVRGKLDALLYLQCKQPQNRGDSVCRGVMGVSR